MQNNPEKLTQLNAASYANGYKPIISSAKSIGYRPNTLKYIDRSSYKNSGEEFLINSYATRFDIENTININQYTSDSELLMLSMMEQRDYSGIEAIELPDSIALELSLGESLLRRRSERIYTGDSITMSHLASVLRAAYGISSQAIVRSNSGAEIPVNLRTVASGGGLYPLTLLVAAINIKHLSKGIYEYGSHSDSLYRLGGDDMLSKALTSYAMSDELVSLSRANFIVLIVGNAWKSMRKYGSKGLRFMLQEIGAVSQNIHLANISLGLSSTDCAAYYENEMNSVMNFDGVNQSILHSVITGVTS